MRMLPIWKVHNKKLSTRCLKHFDRHIFILFHCNLSTQSFCIILTFPLKATYVNFVQLFCIFDKLKCHFRFSAFQDDDSVCSHCEEGVGRTHYDRCASAHAICLSFPHLQHISTEFPQ